MKHNFYTTYATGLIDGLLMKTKAEGYYVGFQKRNNVIESNSFGENRSGDITTPIDEFLYDYLCKLELKPSFGSNIDYDYEFATPFEDTINKALLLMKWCIGIQRITGKPATITRDRLKAIDMSHLSVLDVKKLFERILRKSLTLSYYADNEYQVRFGPRELMLPEGPGSVKLKMDYLHIIDQINKDLQALQEAE